MDTVGKIEVTAVALTDLVRAAYNRSRPQGLGHIHYQDGGLSDAEVAKIIESTNLGRLAVSMDYVKGRSVKFHVHRIENRLFIDSSWYDHSDGQLRSLLEQVGLSGELVDKARAERAAYDAKCIEAAVAYITGHGGQCTTRYDADDLPREVRDGLYAGKYTKPPRFKEEYKAGVSTWSLS